MLFLTRPTVFFGVTTIRCRRGGDVPFRALYYAVTGIYSSTIRYSRWVLRMHLLFTDPSTSPRTELGRGARLFYGSSSSLVRVLEGRDADLLDKLLPFPS